MTARLPHLLVAGDHPSPDRERVALAALFFGVTAGPLAWIAQLVIDYIVAARACFPHDQALTSAPTGGAWTAALVVNLVAIAIALASFAVSAASWRASRNEHSGKIHHLVEAGEGRTRFMALCGQIAGLGFLLAIVFDTVTLFTVPPCSG